eukprot:TRINITY_DN4939_c0_g1_i3.p1 TRINITY_DN4939_c0_g1~~TRINITY_DN4939_c0_g1_i3.p1  ORF type:complete len:173 (+),score=12.94 TRINITY_DN4939_c0_g1_i3:539-1057(+)
MGLQSSRLYNYSLDDYSISARLEVTTPVLDCKAGRGYILLVMKPQDRSYKIRLLDATNFSTILHISHPQLNHTRSALDFVEPFGSYVLLKEHSHPLVIYDLKKLRWIRPRHWSLTATAHYLLLPEKLSFIACVVDGKRFVWKLQDDMKAEPHLLDTYISVPHSRSFWWPCRS